MPFPAVNRRFMRPWARNGQHIGGRRTSQGRQLTGNILGRFIGGGIPGGRRSILLALGRPPFFPATSQGGRAGRRGGIPGQHPRAADKPVSLGGRQLAVNIPGPAVYPACPGPAAVLSGNIPGGPAVYPRAGSWRGGIPGGRRSILLALGRPPFFPATSLGGPGRPARRYPRATSQGRR